MLTLRYRTGKGDEGERLDDLLGRWLPQALGRPLSRSAVRTLLVSGAVVVGDRPVRRPGFLLAAGVRLTARLDPGRLPAAPGEKIEDLVRSVAIVFEDDMLLAVSKPAGLLTHPSADARRTDLFTAVTGLLASRGPAAERRVPYLGLHHRLDRETSGLVLFTKAPEANEQLARQFERRAVRKTYLALVSAPRPPARHEWTVVNRLALAGSGRRARMASVADGGAPAETAFRVLDWHEPAALVEAHPLTGRKHQVRAHLADSGLPIAGDLRYGGPQRLTTMAVPRAMLHALRLELDHPTTGRRLILTSSLPDDFVALLRALRLSPGPDRPTGNVGEKG